MKVAILCGGKGTRLAELTEGIPKGLIPIGGRPIVWHIMRYFASFGHSDFVLLVGYQAHRFADYFHDQLPPGWTVAFVDSGAEASKSRRLLDARPHLAADRFFLSYGDDLTDVDLEAVVRKNTVSGATATLTAVRPLDPFGSLEMNAADQVVRFVEKGRLPHWINGGYMVIRPSIFPYLERGELETTVFPLLAERGEITAYKHAGFWISMNTYKDSQELDRIWNGGEPPWRRWPEGDS
jgi:glucose-1-phosphate cytidylyltransferase